MFGGGACTYEGDWVEDEWSGQGRLECRGAGSAAAVDGPELELQVYTGAFHRGARHGEGRAEYASGAWAQGKFRNDSLVEVRAAAVREQRGPWLIVGLACHRVSCTTLMVQCTVVSCGMACPMVQASWRTRAAMCTRCVLVAVPPRPVKRLLCC